MIISSRISTPRGRAYSEGKILDKHYEHLWLLKGHDSTVRGSSMSIFFALNLRYGYQYPEALLQVIILLTRSIHQSNMGFANRLPVRWRKRST